MTTQLPINIPIASFAAQVCLGSLLVGFTDSGSPFRFVGLPAIGGLFWLVFKTVSDGIRPAQAGLVVATAFAFTLQYCEVALVRRASFKDSPKWPHDTFWNRLCFGTYIICSMRAVGTKWQAGNVPPVKTTSRTASLVRSVWVCLVVFLWFDLASLNPQVDHDDNFVRVKEYVLTRFCEVDRDELVLRAIASLSSYIKLYGIFSFWGEMMSFVTVLLGICDPSQWPPIFGSVGDAWSLRQFWGSVRGFSLFLFYSHFPLSVFWHQWLTLPFCGPATWFTQSVLGLKRNTPTAKYAHLFLVFFLSGTLHTISNIANRVSPSHTGAMMCFAPKHLAS